MGSLSASDAALPHAMRVALVVFSTGRRQDGVYVPIPPNLILTGPTIPSSPRGRRPLFVLAAPEIGEKFSTHQTTQKGEKRNSSP